MLAPLPPTATPVVTTSITIAWLAYCSCGEGSCEDDQPGPPGEADLPSLQARGPGGLGEEAQGQGAGEQVQGAAGSLQVLQETTGHLGTGGR